MSRHCVLAIMVVFCARLALGVEPPEGRRFALREAGRLAGLEPEVLCRDGALYLRTTDQVLVTHLDTTSPLYDRAKHTGLMDVAGIIDGPTTVLAVPSGKTLRVPLGHAVMIQGPDPHRRLAVLFVVDRLRQARLFLHDQDPSNPAHQHGGRSLVQACDHIKLAEVDAETDILDLEFAQDISFE